MEQRLLVEGINDIKVIGSLCQALKMPRPLWHESNDDYGRFVIVTKGKDNLLKRSIKFDTSISATLKIPELQNLGIVVDADENIDKRWQSIIAILTNAGYTNLPKAPSVKGTIILEDTLPKIGIWIMPNNQLSGYLEHFVELMIPANDDLFSIAQATTQNLIESSRNLFRPVDKQKVDIYTWLAWQSNPGVPMGTAIHNKYLDANSPGALQFIEWMKNTFQYPLS